MSRLLGPYMTGNTVWEQQIYLLSNIRVTDTILIQQINCQSLWSYLITWLLCNCNQSHFDVVAFRTHSPPMPNFSRERRKSKPLEPILSNAQATSEFVEIAQVKSFFVKSGLKDRTRSTTYMSLELCTASKNGDKRSVLSKSWHQDLVSKKKTKTKNQDLVQVHLIFVILSNITVFYILSHITRKQVDLFTSLSLSYQK